MLHANILIPCKRFSEGKSRLARLLPDDARHELCVFLLERTLNVARRLAPPGWVWLVTADDDASAIGKAAGLNVIRDSAGTLNAALCQARDHIVRREGPWRSGLAILPIDLPLVDAKSIMSADRDSDVCIAGDRHDSGTNLLLLKRNAVRDFHFAFGANSLERHREIAQRAGYTVSVVKNPALAFDIDEPEDYFRAERLGRLERAGMPA
jgi:2-phospho-L-lactate/phosphoenolpyruvate guanylyltransferase